MSSINCKECGESFPENEDACPNCGCPKSFSINGKTDIVLFAGREEEERRQAAALLNATEDAERKATESKRKKEIEEEERRQAAALLNATEDAERKATESKRKKEIEEEEKRQAAAYRKAKQSKSSNNFVEGLGRIGEAEGLGEFDAKRFFGGIKKKYSEEKLTNSLFGGTAKTTPSIKTISTEYPQPWLFYRLIAASVFIFYAFKILFDQSANPNLITAIIITGSFGVPISTLILFLELNIRRNIPIWTIGKLFFGGAILSFLITEILANNTIGLIGWAGAPSAAVLEEPAKLISLFLLTRTKKKYPYILNGLLLGAAVGCGFAAFESAAYALRYGLTYGYDVLIRTITLRGILSPFAHIVWTAVAGAALWRVQKGGDFSFNLLKNKRFYAPFGTIIICHAVWNSPFSLPFMGKFIICGVTAWILALSLLNLGIKQIADEKAGKQIFKANNL